MKIHRQLAATLLFMATPLAIFATDKNNISDSIRKVAPPGMSISFYSCLDKADTSTLGDAACIMREKSHQDARLNKAYKKLLSYLKDDMRNQLIASERAWGASRANDNYFEEKLYSGGSQIGNLEQEQNDTFRLCERANVMEKYLAIARLTL